MKVISRSLVFCLLIIGHVAYGRTGLSTYQIEQLLRMVPANYAQDGDVAEEIARIETYQIFPIEHYEIFRNVEYNDHDGHTIGELDLLVVNRATGKVAMIGEVKGGDSEAGIQKARKQRERFLDSLEEKKISSIHLRHNPEVKFQLEQFDSQFDFRLIGVRGQVKAHYLDMVLSFSSAEIHQLALRLVQFQKFRWRAHQKATGMKMKFHAYINRSGPVDDFDYSDLLDQFGCSQTFTR